MKVGLKMSTGFFYIFQRSFRRRVLFLWRRFAGRGHNELLRVVNAAPEVIKSGAFKLNAAVRISCGLFPCLQMY